MKLLLDTHALIWFVEGNATLSETARQQIIQPNNAKFVSIISFWEMMIKINLGKLTIKMEFSELHRYLLEHSIQILPLQFTHILRLSDLPHHHKDPFDRILIAQAKSENMTLVSADSNIALYDVSLLW